MARITLLTDFGTEDGFVGAMKGVLATHAPMAPVEDITHAVPPGDVRKAQSGSGPVLAPFPPRTVHLVVVDPGVGTGRRSLALRADERLLVGPDNGLFSLVFSEAEEWVCVELKPSKLLPASHQRNVPWEGLVRSGGRPPRDRDPLGTPRGNDLGPGPPSGASRPRRWADGWWGRWWRWTGSATSQRICPRSWCG